MMRRRGLFGLLGVALVAPAVVKAGAIMPVRSLTPVADMLEWRFNAGMLLEHGVYEIERPITLYGGTGGKLLGSRITTPDGGPPRCGLGRDQCWITIPRATPAHLDRERMSVIEGNFITPKSWTPSSIRLRTDWGMDG